ncbi:MAG: CcmD family protein [Bacteroidetes bacterium]|nr:CcmD family protein [Bacteroidota bacterium]
MRKITAIAITLLTTLSATAQGEQPIHTLMESNLKIYVVVGVLTIIFVGIIIFLMALDSRLKKLESNA